ncbi:MAG: proline racemase family protein [Truepera sp.]|nr:proline racemase family protein [Truepera sp.]
MRWKRTVTVVGCHAEGEVGRVITGGVLPPPGETIFDQKRYLEKEADGLRRFLLFEPRGGVFVHTNLVVPPTRPEVDAAFIIMEPTDYPPMSGSNSICVATVLLETGMVPMTEPETRLLLEAPGGLVEAVATCRDGKCERVRVRNVPSFVNALDVDIEVPGLGSLKADVAYGGAFFAIVDAPALGFALTPDEARDLVEVGERIKAAVVEQHPAIHPENSEIHTVTFTQFAAPVETDPEGVKTGRNAVVISPGKIDRSPCGTGTSARLAVLHARGKLRVGEPYISRSPLETVFHAQITATTTLKGVPAVLPSISGRAWITGLHHYGLDPTDPFPEGYALTDTWYRVPS